MEPVPGEEKKKGLTGGASDQLSAAKPGKDSGRSHWQCKPHHTEKEDAQYGQWGVGRGSEQAPDHRGGGRSCSYPWTHRKPFWNFCHISDGARFGFRKLILAVGIKRTWMGRETPVFIMRCHGLKGTETCQLCLAGEGRTEIRYRKSIS